jgi:dihydrofolate synthase/folylpolyglutamate synthase
MEVLGSTLAAIALDKLELTAAGGTSILGPSLAPLQAQLCLQADLLRIATLPFDAVADLVVSTADAEGSTFSLRADGLRIGGVRLNLPGRFQPTNFAIAAALAKKLLESDGQYSSAQFVTAVRDAAAELSWAGRLQRISDDPVVTIDVGHSPGAIDAALQSYLGFASAERSLLVVGCSHNKDVVGMVTALAPHFGHIICTRAHHKGAAVDEVARYTQRANPTAMIETADPIEKASWLAVERARAQERPVYVAGGLFLSIEFAQALSGGDPTRLRFF